MEKARVKRRSKKEEGYPQKRILLQKRLYNFADRRDSTSKRILFPYQGEKIPDVDKKETSISKFYLTNCEWKPFETIKCYFRGSFS